MKATRGAALLVATVASIVVAEAIARAIDGYAIFSLALRRTRFAEPTATPDRRHLPSGLADGVNPAWYELDPPPVPRVPDSPELDARQQKYPRDVYESLYVWNAAYLRHELCAGNRTGPLGKLDDFYTFEPGDGKPFPTYRHLPHINPAGWFTTNNFGWRGPDVSAARTSDTIRIAFVGASTTIDAYAYKFSHPELVGYWLNLWAQAAGLPYRIEVINAGRSGIDSPSLSAIVRNEVTSVDPDLVIYYEGANSFGPVQMLDVPPSIPRRPEATFRKRSPLEDYSAIAVRVFDAILKTGQDGSEPRKPAYRFAWPTDIDEQSPDVTRPVLPMHLEHVVADLDSIRTALARTGGELAIASFVWMVYPGMQLDLSRHVTLFRYLNDSYWPVTYEEMRRLADFQNRVFRNYAQRYGVLYLPMDETYPRDPDLFGDAVHMTPRGLRLRAWFYLQELVPIIEARVAAHRWPKVASPNVPSAAWASVPPTLVSRDAILAACPRQ